MGRKIIEVKDTDAAYMAGFFDGEGSVYAATRWHRTNEGNRRPTPTITCCISNVNKAVLDYHRTMFGGSLNSRRQNERRQQLWQWSICAKMAEPYLRAMLPFLIVKREIVSVALEYIDLQKAPPHERRDYSKTVYRHGRLWVAPTVRPEFRDKVLALHAEIKRMNLRGGPFNALRGPSTWTS